MQLLVDIGNSCLKWATVDGGVLQPGQRCAYRAAELAQTLDASWANLQAPQRIVVSNVGGERCAAALAAWTEQRWRVRPQFIRAEAQAYGVVNGYAEPGRLGTDRWAALLAARQLTGAPACIIDCGSAITLDVLAADGVHLGGLIVPGLQMMRRALLQDTQGIKLDGGGPARVSLLARDTEGAVGGGVLYAAVAVIDRVVSDVAQALDAELARIITGGDAPQLLPLLAGRYVHQPDLVLQGLALIAADR